MRKIIVCNMITLDGYFADANGIPPIPGMDEFFDAYNLERITAASTVLLGRASYEFFGGYWPGIADAPADPDNRSVDEVNRGISQRWNEIEKVAVSDTLQVPDDHPWRDRTLVVPRADIGAWLKSARETGEGDLVIFGSHLLWNALLADGLVDEVHLMIASIAFGAGIPAFESATALTLTDVQRRPGSDNALLRYLPHHS